MATEWNNRTYRFNPNDANSNGPFQEHDKQMREFRASHTNVALVNGLMLDEAAFLESLLFLRVNYIMETGGSRYLNSLANWSAIVPAWQVGQYRLSSN